MGQQCGSVTGQVRRHKGGRGVWGATSSVAQLLTCTEIWWGWGGGTGRVAGGVCGGNGGSYGANGVEVGGGGLETRNCHFSSCKFYGSCSGSFSTRSEHDAAVPTIAGGSPDGSCCIGGLSYVRAEPCTSSY